MSTFRLTRRRLVAVGAVVVAAASVGVAVAAFPDSDVETYTGCLNVAGTSGGTISQVAAGLSPLKPCGSNQKLVRLSGGDITAVRTPPGSGLSGGSENGAVSLSLDAAHSLPQGCAEFAFPMIGTGSGWVCAQHDVGTGLNRSRTASGTSGSIAYSIDPAYRVKNNTDCESGKFATGFDDDGTIQCAAPAAPEFPASGAGQGAGLDAGDGVPDDGDYHTYVSSSVAAGDYLVWATGVLEQDDDDVGDFLPSPDGGHFGCRIGNSPAAHMSFAGKDNEVDEYPFALTAVVTTHGEPITLQCRATEDYDKVSVRHGWITALKLG